MKKISFSCVFAALILASPNVTRAELIINIYQSGNNVIVASVAGGTLDLANLTKSNSPTNIGSVLFPKSGYATVGPANAVANTSIYSGGITGPSIFGSGLGSENYYHNASSSSAASGGVFGIYASSNGAGTPEIYVSQGYTSGGIIPTITDTFNSTTLSGLGLTPGTSFTYTWGSGAHADSLVVNVPAPEPASITMVISAAVIGLGARRWSRRRAARG
jgi:hypothetical protein